ncbi:hypothetical protein SBRCBS47491_009300 [Sporothrix bragantina]|uniref:Xylanolytic transcriptional activator regulatory domain-containing protein n=1 Tax=Sporothrix bragantina TaxID=671064 RepID=A0ABP0CWY0_9PEZI
MAIRDETISTSILLAICAVGARFTSPPEPEEVARAWADDAGQRVMSASECSRETVAVALLLNIYSQQAMRFAQAHNWGAVAMNQAVTLGLHREVTPVRGIPTFDEAEGDRRLFFACYTINRFASNGQPAAVSCPTPCIKQRLPCDGFNYRLDVSVETPYALLEDDESHVPAWMYKNVGAMGFWVRLVGARFMVKQSFQAMMNAGQATTHEQDNEQPGTIEAPPTPGTSSSTLNPLLPWHPGSLFSASVAKLATIRESLPPRQRLHSGLLHRKRNTTGLGQIVMFYLWWNECHLELCSIVLPGYPQSLDPAMLATAPAGWVDHTREHCLRYARAIIDIVVLVEQETSRDHPLVIYDHTVAHAVYLGLRVQLEIGGVDILDTRTKERFEMALHLVERTAKYFHSIALLVKEMRRMLDVYYNGPPPPNEATADDSAASTQLRRPETPPLPWFRRLKDIEAERQAQRHNYQNPDRIETVLLELLPDYSSYGMLGAWSGTPAYEGDGFYSHVGHLDLQDAWGQPMNEVNAVNAVDAAAVASAANSMHTMGAMPGAAAATFHQPHPHPSAFAEPGGPRASSGATGMPMMDYHLDDDLLPNVVSLPPTAVGGPFFLPSGGYQ